MIILREFYQNRRNAAKGSLPPVYGSRCLSTTLSNLHRSHQLGEGQETGAEMPYAHHPSRSVYGSQGSGAAMPMRDRSHQLREGQSINTEMSGVVYPSRPVYGSLIRIAEMLALKRSHQLGKGQRSIAEMPVLIRPSQPVYGSRNHNAAMPMEKRSHLFTRGRCVDAAMLNKYRLSREGSSSYHSNVTWTAPFLTSLREPIELRRNVNLNYLPPVLGHPYNSERTDTPRPILTRGHHSNAAMLVKCRLAREGSDDLRSNVTSLSPFPTSFGPPQPRSNANLKTPN